MKINNAPDLNTEFVFDKNNKMNNLKDSLFYLSNFS